MGRDHRQELDSATIRGNNRSLGYWLSVRGRVLSSFAVDIGLQASNSHSGREFFENDHIIDAFQGSQEFHSLRRRENRAPSSLELAHGSVTVYSHNQNTA